jgi:hypothetical protein
MVSKIQLCILVSIIFNEKLYMYILLNDFQEKSSHTIFSFLNSTIQKLAVGVLYHRQ